LNKYLFSTIDDAIGEILSAVFRKT